MPRPWRPISLKLITLVRPSKSSRVRSLPDKTGYYQEGRDEAQGITGSRQASALNTFVMAVAEANYGRMDKSLRYVNFIASELDKEQPGALPELFDSPDYMYFQDFKSRAMVVQAWSSYVAEWRVVYHFLGIRPQIPNREITIIPASRLPGQPFRSTTCELVVAR